ncbi:hypothetical protein [Sagittula salina]|uniref:Lipoprotein n=1 Tax=Sagittula salina TaxID=2820268 RepID=A0A940S212_9RHOB|nr:hypothetical protein [Sagittula salina]MBP0481130.1 hypothetical protein [Sagittula salina]
MAKPLQRLRIPFAIVALLFLASCGDTPGQSAAVGMAAGGAAAMVLEKDMLSGAAIGAGANIAYCSQFPARC